MGLTTSRNGSPGRLDPGVAASGNAPAILDDALAVALTWREYGAQARRAATAEETR
jgi:hypothetical protein